MQLALCVLFVRYEMRNTRPISLFLTCHGRAALTGSGGYGMRVVIAAVIFFTFFSGIGLAINRGINRAPRIGAGTVGSPVVPPSSRRSGLVRSPVPTEISGNLLITGNVSGGRHFRGVVPYRSTSTFGLETASSLLESFLRYSAGSGDFRRFSGTYRPYYSASRTVTTTRPGYPGAFRSSTANVENMVGWSVGRLGPSMPGTVGRFSRFADSPFQFRGFQSQKSVFGVPRPMSRGQQELERVILSEVERYSPDRGTIPIDEVGRQYQDWMGQSRGELKRVSNRAAELERSLIGQGDSLLPSIKSGPSEGVWQLVRAQRPKERTQTSEAEPTDVYEQMKRQVEEFQKIYESWRAATEEPVKEAVDSEKEPVEKSSSLDELSGIDLSARAKGILGEHKTFASYSRDKFNQYLRAAEEYLKQGKYYRAADAYTLASVYKPGDPLAYVGKSHALFAAGEYMSSALFLSRALEIFPGYARFRIDIEAMVGDRDKLESRIADVEQWLGNSGAGELEFLLGYVYYQMGRFQRAKKAIDAAYEKMPGSPAVIVLKGAIDEFVVRGAY